MHTMPQLSVKYFLLSSIWAVLHISSIPVGNPPCAGDYRIEIAIN